MTVALNVFEKARYSSSPITTEEYVILKESIQLLKNA